VSIDSRLRGNDKVVSFYIEPQQPHSFSLVP
jgi:hypothetical protein